MQVARLEADRLQSRHAERNAVGRRRERCGEFDHRPLSQRRRVDLPQPRGFVWRENAVGRACRAQDLVALEHHVVLAGVQRDAVGRQRAAHLGVALQRVRIVVVARVDCLHRQALRQRNDLPRRFAMAHQQPGARAAGLPRRPVEVAIERDQGVSDELDATIDARQRVEEGAVEHERAPHPLRRAQRVVQGRVVAHAQVASQPHECGGEGLVGHWCHRAGSP